MWAAGSRPSGVCALPLSIACKTEGGLPTPIARIAQRLTTSDPIAITANVRSALFTGTIPTFTNSFVGYWQSIALQGAILVIGYNASGNYQVCLDFPYGCSGNFSKRALLFAILVAFPRYFFNSLLAGHQEIQHENWRSLEP